MGPAKTNNKKEFDSGDTNRMADISKKLTNASKARDGIREFTRAVSKKLTNASKAQDGISEFTRAVLEGDEAFVQQQVGLSKYGF